MKAILLSLLVMLIAPTAAFAKIDSDCKKNPIYCKIIKFNPKIDRVFALQLSDKIVRKSKASGVDPNVSLAILMQESGLVNQNTYKDHTVTERYCDEKKCYIVEKHVKEAFDMTIAQINIGTANQFGFDIERLFNMDLEYALDCHYVILKAKIIMCAGQQYPWACYHSANEPYKTLYIELVKRYL